MVLGEYCRNMSVLLLKLCTENSPERGTGNSHLTTKSSHSLKMSD